MRWTYNECKNNEQQSEEKRTWWWLQGHCPGTKTHWNTNIKETANHSSKLNKNLHISTQQTATIASGLEAMMPLAVVESNENITETWWKLLLTRTQGRDSSTTPLPDKVHQKRRRLRYSLRKISGTSIVEASSIAEEKIPWFRQVDSNS